MSVQQKSPLLILHGWGQTHQNLTPLAKRLPSNVDPILLDLPGFGNARTPPTTWSAFDYADHFINYLDVHEIEKTAVLGHSFGGKVAMCLAIRYPHRVKQLILLAPSGLRPQPPFTKKLRMNGIKILGKAIKGYDRVFQSEHFKTFFIPQYGSRDYQQAGDMRSILVRSVNEDLSEEVKQIRCPTLLLWGEKDSATPLEMAHRLLQSIPRAKLQLFPHHDHYLFEDVGAHLMATYISAFLQENS